MILDLTVRGGMGGKEAIQQLIDIDPDVKGIVSSGYSDDPGMTNYKKYGFSGVVAKPYTLEELGEKLSQVLKSWSFLTRHIRNPVHDAWMLVSGGLLAGGQLAKTVRILQPI